MWQKRRPESKLSWQAHGLQGKHRSRSPLLSTPCSHPCPCPRPENARSSTRHPINKNSKFIRYIEGDITASERVAWESNFEAKPEALTAEEKDAFLTELTGVSLSSDAFFPFRDSIDHASKARGGGGGWRAMLLVLFMGHVFRV